MSGVRRGAFGFRRDTQVIPSIDPLTSICDMAEISKAQATGKPPALSLYSFRSSAADWSRRI